MVLKYSNKIILQCIKIERFKQDNCFLSLPQTSSIWWDLILLQGQIVAQKRSFDKNLFHNRSYACLVVHFYFELLCNVQRRKIFPCLKAECVVLGGWNRCIPEIKLYKNLCSHLRTNTVEKTNKMYLAMSSVWLKRNKFSINFSPQIWKKSKNTANQLQCYEHHFYNVCIPSFTFFKKIQRFVYWALNSSRSFLVKATNFCLPKTNLSDRNSFDLS